MFSLPLFIMKQGIFPFRLHHWTSVNDNLCWRISVLYINIVPICMGFSWEHNKWSRFTGDKSSNGDKQCK